MRLEIEMPRLEEAHQSDGRNALWLIHCLREGLTARALAPYCKQPRRICLSI